MLQVQDQEQAKANNQKTPPSCDIQIPHNSNPTYIALHVIYVRVLPYNCHGPIENNSPQSRCVPTIKIIMLPICMDSIKSRGKNHIKTLPLPIAS